MGGIIQRHEAVIAILNIPTKKGKVTVSGKMGKDVPIGTLKSVLKQAGIEQ